MTLLSAAARRAAATTVLLVAAVLVPVVAPRATAWTRSPVRVSGTDRYATAVALSQTLFPNGAPTVFVASGEAFPDALAGGAAAGTAGAPLLLTGSAALPDVVAGELSRLAPSNVVVLGGPSAVSDGVLAQIASATGVAPTRLAGPTRYDTAAAIAATFPSGGTVFVATGASFADGLAAGPAAGMAKRPVLLVAPDAVPAATGAQLERLQPSEIVVLGGTAAVSDAVVATLGQYSPNVHRVAGDDRYATAAAVARAFFPGPPEAWFVSGVSFPDALSAGPAATLFQSPLLLTLPACVPSSTTAVLQSLSWPNLTVIGGTDAVSVAAEQVQPCSTVPDGDLAPGVHLDTYVLDGPNVARVVVVDRGEGMDVRNSLATGGLSGRLPTTEIARRWNAVVAVNGDMFESNGRPAHAFATGGRMIREPALVEDEVGFDATDPHHAYLGTPEFGVTATVEETAVSAPIARVNDGDPGAGELAVYTPENAGTATPPSGVCVARLAPHAPPGLGADGEAVQSHVVTATSCGAAPSVGSDDLLVAPSSGSLAPFVTSLSPGQHVDLSWLANPQWPNLLDATGSNTTLVHGGAPSDDVVFGDPPFYTTVAPRTAVGWLADGREVLVTVDGRQPGYSVGMTPMELAQFLVSIGVVEATNLDGGGSTTLVVGGILANRPSDPTGERAVGDALVVVPHGAPAAPPFAGSGVTAPTFDPLLAHDAASLGGQAATLAARGEPLSPELATMAQAFSAAGG